eukprot:TRINITY_DN7938_c4_g1_i1.p1 TRINITY_DN7938_c4_g1~~TRINITY_DN7938_c4_g1_i1.p1  ORF type:complete len:351 (+),score=56.62 TRINITY_DN7938_c4_g1_i1:33-1055(+)
MVAVSVSIVGLHGGHSGVDIHKEYGNAIKLLARLMLQSFENDQRLVDLRGGTGPSAIPREASCIVQVSSAAVEAYLAKLKEEFAEIKAEFASVDPGMELNVNICPEGVPEPLRRSKLLISKAWRCSRCPKCQAAEIAAPPSVPTKISEEAYAPPPRLQQPRQSLSPSSTKKVFQFCIQVPHGVLRKSTEVPDLTESSVGFGMAELREGHLFCHLFLRSSVNSYLPYGQKMLSSLGDLAGAENVENIYAFPAWQPCLESPFLAVLKSTHAQLFGGKEPRIYAIHAGLECGSLKQTEPHLDCCSIGPLIMNAHSPDERINIASGGRFVKWLQAILESLAKEA